MRKMTNTIGNHGRMMDWGNQLAPSLPRILIEGKGVGEPKTIACAYIVAQATV